MKFSIKKMVLVGILERAFVAAPRTSIIPVYQSVQLILQDGLLSAIGSDGEITIISTTREVEAHLPGKLVVNPRFRDCIKASVDATITIEATAPTISILCAGNHTELPMSKEEYPDLNYGQDMEIPVDKEQLYDALTHCRPVAAQNNIQTNCMYVQIGLENPLDPTSPTVIRSTDNSRLHQIDFPYPVQTLIPQRVIADLQKMLKACPDPQVGIGRAGDRIFFHFENDIMYVTGHTVKFPDAYDQMILPTQDFVQEMEVGRIKLQNAVKRVALVSDADNLLTMQLDFDRLTLSARDLKGATSEESLEVVWKHDERELQVNHVYLMELLSIFKDPLIRMRVGPDASRRRSLLHFSETGKLGILVQLNVSPRFSNQSVASIKAQRPNNGPDSISIDDFMVSVKSNKES